MTHSRILVVRLAAVVLATGLLLPAVAVRAANEVQLAANDVHLAAASPQRNAPAKKPHHAPAAKAKPKPKAAGAKAAPKAKHTAKVVAKRPKAHPKAKAAPKPKKLGSRPVRSELQAVQELAASAGSRAATALA